MDIKIALERGDYVKRRAELMKTLEVPRLSDAITALGPSLAQLVLEECDDALKENFGLTPPLTGAGGELWVSPSDLLIGKVVLKPPYTQKHIQALTHQGILTIGTDIEMKYWNEMEMEKERALAEQRKRMLEEFEDQLKAEIKLVELREQAACQREIERINEEFEARLIEELANLESRLRSEFEELFKEQEMMLREEFARTLQKEVEKTVQKLTREFLIELERQKNILSSNFKLGLQKVYAQAEYDIGMERTKCKENIRQLKQNLECKNIANMMYVLCMERRKCCDEKAAIEKHYETEIGILSDTITQKDQEIKELTDEKNKQIMEVNLRETCLLEIIRQFQKFINFALRAAPTQAEFLLSVEKMMVFELADAVLKSSFKDCTPHEEILPWYSLEKICKGPKMIGLEIKDYHDCFNEIDPPRPPNEELGPNDFLPAFNYREKLYVREDFRNMISQGIEISQSNMLWSKDVEILMETLKKSVSSMHIEEEEDFSVQDKTHVAESSIQFRTEQERKLHEKCKRVSLDKESLSIGGKDTDLRSSMKATLETLQAIDFSKIGKVEKEPAILATTCSLELMIRKGSIKYVGEKTLECVDSIDKQSEAIEEQPDAYVECNEAGNLILQSMVRSEESLNIITTKTSDQLDDNSADFYKPAEGTAKHYSTKDSLVLGARDSIILRKSSLMRKSGEFQALPKDSIEVQKDSKFDLKTRPSKLTTARNSLEMIRESKLKLRDSAAKCVKKVPSKAKSTGGSIASGKDIFCCEKCMKPKDNSVEVLDGLAQESKQQSRRESVDKSIKVSHIEVIDAAPGGDDTNVAFNTTPIVYETGSATYSTNLSGVYEDEETNKASKKKIRPPKDKFLSQPKKLKVLGDTDAKEHLQSTDEFGMERIQSFIKLIKDHPNLMRTFTACTR